MSKEYIDWQVDPERPFVVIDDSHNPRTIAIVDVDGTEGKRYASLMAASPRLLEACENYLYGRKDARECESDMRAAIEKARETHE